jgi:hypothetical protein
MEQVEQEDQVEEERYFKWTRWYQSTTTTNGTIRNTILEVVEEVVGRPGW